MTVAVAGLTKRYRDHLALDAVDLDIRPGEFVALLGPSGSGKTTLLRIIGGLDFPDAGTVTFGGEDVAGRAARDRRVGFVFQNYALFRHMRVADNIAFGLTVKPRRDRPAPAVIAARVEELLALVQLPGLGRRFPAQLSGGQRQRVALARALAVEPSVLLLDEPFGALDAKVRNDLRRWLRGVHEGMGLTSIFVTHDQDEALDLADRVAVMSDGRIEQVDTPDAIYNRPATAFVADFIGNATRFDCRLAGGAVELAGVRLPNAAPPCGDGPGVAFVRPHEFVLAAAGQPGLAAIVRRVAHTAARASVECVLADDRVVDVSAPLDVAATAGAAVVLVPVTVRAYPV